MTIEEIKEWRNTVETHGIGIAGEFVVEIIDTLLAEVEELKQQIYDSIPMWQAKDLVYEARQEAARTIERHLLGMFWCIPSKENEPMIYRDQAIEWLRGYFKLEG